MTRHTLGRPPHADVAIAALAAAALIADGLRRDPGAAALPGCIVAIAACAPLAWRRTAPVPALCAVFAGVLATLPLLHPYTAALPVVMVALYTVAAQGERKRSLIVGAVSAVVLVGVVVLVSHHEGVAGEAALRLVLALGALVVGDTVRARRELAASARRERDAERRSRAEAERLSIARELHDTVAHALVAINVRAGVTAVLADTTAMPAALNEIREVSAEALDDLRTTLGVLRAPGEEAPEGPELTLADVPMLVERASAAGIATQVEIDLGDRPIPSPIGQAGYRIVQESLTNVMRHAGANRVRVRVRLVAGAVHIDVIDDGRPAAVAGPPGHGLRGMHERASVLGGRVSAGPDDAGGWRVTAHLPLAPTIGA